MKNLLAIVILLYISAVSHSQTLRQSFVSSEREIILLDAVDESVIFLFKDFRDAIVYYRGGREMKLKLDYYLIKDEMFMLNSQGAVHVLSTTMAPDSIVFPNDGISFIWSKTDGFMEKVPSCPDCFIKHRTRYVISEVQQGGYGQSRAVTKKDSKFLTDRDIMLRESLIHLNNPSAGTVEITLTYRPTLVIVANQQFVSVANQRDLNRLYRAKRNQISNYVMKENIAFDNKNDLVKLAAFLDNLD
jgi:hypothetical protein